MENLDQYEEVVEYGGAFVASYVVQGGEGFIGYVKICTTRPESVWVTPDAFAKYCTDVRSSARDASIHAKILAFNQMDGR